MNAWKVIFATLLIFATGLIVGGMFMHKADVGNPTSSRPASGPNGAGQFRLQSLQMLLRRMDRELALTPDQEEQIKKIIATSQDRTGELFKPVAQQMAQETQDACAQIRDVLTPEQQAKFDALPKNRPGERGERGGERGERGSWRRGPGGPTNHFNTNPPRLFNSPPS